MTYKQKAAVKRRIKERENIWNRSQKNTKNRYQVNEYYGCVPNNEAIRVLDTGRTFGGFQTEEIKGTWQLFNDRLFDPF